MNNHSCNIRTVRAQELCEDTATVAYCLEPGTHVDLCLSHAQRLMRIQYDDDRA